MHCCGHALTRREWMWATALSSLGPMISAASAAPRSEAPAALASPTPAEKLLRDNISIDVHTHAGPKVSPRGPRAPAVRSRRGCGPAAWPSSAWPTCRMVRSWAATLPADLRGLRQLTTRWGPPARGLRVT
jgi:hypothetical protein